MSANIDYFSLFENYYQFVRSLLKNDAKNSEQLINDSIFTQIDSHLSNDHLRHILTTETKLWHKLVKVTLKTALSEELSEEWCERVGSKLLLTLNNMIDKTSDASLENTLNLIVGHSMFKDVLIDEKYNWTQLKHALVSILCSICEKDNTLCSTDFTQLILSAYNATLDLTDQKLLRLLALFEANDCKLIHLSPFLWGIEAAIHYSTKNKSKSALLSQPKMEQILSLFEDQKLRKTFANFPRHLKLIPIEIDTQLAMNDGKSLYDPRFVLPLFYQMLSPQSVVKCHKFVSHGALSMAIVSTTSSCDLLRSVAYNILHRFYQHLEYARYPNDRFLWIAILDYIRSGISVENSKIPNLIALFVVRVIDILLHPSDKLFNYIKKYIVCRPVLEFNSMPSFYDIINSNDINNYTRCQRFIVSWIYDGIKDEEDVKICLKRHIFTQMLVLFDSSLCDEQTKISILKLIGLCGRIYLGAKVLCVENAIFCWIKQMLNNFENDNYAQPYMKELFNITCIIWDTIFDRYLLEKNTSSDELLYPTFCYEIIDTFRIFVNVLTDEDILIKYIEICKTIHNNFPQHSPYLSSANFINLVK